MSKTTDKYKEAIEKEAEIRATKYTGFGKGCIMDLSAKYSFFDGINSELNNKIIEIEKREFALEILNDENLRIIAQLCAISELNDNLTNRILKGKSEGLKVAKENIRQSISQLKTEITELKSKI